MNDLPTWSDLNKGVRKMTDKEFEYCEEMEKRKHDDKLKELREVQLLSQHILDLQKDKGKLTDRVTELEQQIEKMKCLLNEIYSEFGFSELVKIRNNLPIEIQEVIKEIKEND